MTRDLGGVVAALALAGACSSSDLHPPVIADCVPNDAGCSTSSVAASVGGGGDDASESCSAASAPGASQCIQCAGAHCCTALTACSNDATCENLLSCEQACGAVSSCFTNCQQEFAAGQATFNALESCLAGSCPVCDEAGIGDPCEDDCVVGLSCAAGGWCSKGCTTSAACAGVGPNGTNAIGQPNACLTVAGAGDVCVPGCASDADCVNFAGTFCYSTTAIDGTAVQVCYRAADASP